MCPGCLTDPCLCPGPRSEQIRPSLVASARRYYEATQRYMEGTREWPASVLRELAQAENDLELALGIITQEEWAEYRRRFPHPDPSP